MPNVWNFVGDVKAGGRSVLKPKSNGDLLEICSGPASNVITKSSCPRTVSFSMHTELDSIPKENMFLKLIRKKKLFYFIFVPAIK